MNIDKAKEFIRNAQSDLDNALKELEDSPIPPDTTIVHTVEEFDAAYSAGKQVITCATDLIYDKPLNLNRPVVIQSAFIIDRRITMDDPCPQFTEGITISSYEVSLFGLQITKRANLNDIVVITGADAEVVKCRILGDPIHGAKRGIALNGPNTLVTQCHIDYCFGPYPGNDCQAIMGWLSEGPFAIEDNYLSGGTETIMFGGGDPSDESNVPCDIVIRGNTITKRAEWQAQAVSVKNTLELKNARRVLIENNDISLSWGGHGQDGYILMITPRNQDGRAPYSGVTDVEIRNNRFSQGSAAINILGIDNNAPSVRVANLNIHDNSFETLDPKFYTGSSKMIQIGDGPTTTTINNNEFVGTGISSTIYFYGSPKCQQLVVTNNKFPTSKYGVFGNNSSTGNDPNGKPKAWNQYVESGDYSGNVIVP